MLFLPQKPYLTIGTLREQLCYPAANGTYNDNELRAALIDCKLEHLVDRLDEEQHWAQLLSGGEQQRIAFARALLYKPDWLFMDEATASLDVPNEAAIYKELKARLPNMTLISIGHSPALRQWHDRLIELQRKSGHVGKLVETPA